MHLRRIGELQLASSYFGPEAERLRAGDSSTEPFPPTVRLGDSVLRVKIKYSPSTLHPSTPSIPPFPCMHGPSPRLTHRTTHPPELHHTPPDIADFSLFRPTVESAAAPEPTTLQWQDVLTRSPRVGVRENKFVEVDDKRKSCVMLKTGAPWYKDYYVALETLAAQHVTTGKAGNGLIYTDAKGNVFVKGFGNGFSNSNQACHHPICMACVKAFSLFKSKMSSKAARAKQLIEILTLSDVQLPSHIREWTSCDTFLAACFFLKKLPPSTEPMCSC